MTETGPSGAVVTPFRPVYLGSGPDTVLALFSHPAKAPARDVAVLLCPPFGWDDVQSYRSRRAWSQVLVGAGYPVARIDLPGTGDSGACARSPGRWDAWTGAVSMAARWLREETGCGRVAAIGIGLGGLIAYSAVTQGAEIDDLGLWGVAARGRAVVRELRAAALIGRSEDAVAAPEPPAVDGTLEFNGFVMTAETLEALARVDLPELTLPDPARRRVLMLGRDGLPPDARLREHLEHAGAAVSVGDGHGYGLMMRDPRLAEPPQEVFAQTVSWLAEAPGEPVRSPIRSEAEAPALTRATMELAWDGETVRETPYSLRASGERLFGILAEPTTGQQQPITAVLFNAGGVRRIGPNRMWVEIARGWAARGVPTLRVDLRGVGDSDGDESPYQSNSAFFRDELTEQALGVLDVLAARGLPERFLLGGLCSGAYWSFQGAARDERVIGAVMINLATFTWDEEVAAALALRNTRALLHGQVPEDLTFRTVREAAVRIARTSVGRHRARVRRAREAAACLDRLRDRGTELLLQFSADEALYRRLMTGDELGDLGRWPNLRLERISGDDHTFRAPGLQDEIRRGFDDALDRALARVTRPPRNGPAPGPLEVKQPTVS